MVATISGAATGDVIKLKGDVTLNSTTVITGKKVTIMADSAVTITANGVVDAFTVGTGGKLTLGGNLSINSNTFVLWAKDGGQIIVDGAKINVTGSLYNAVLAKNSGSITVNSGEINSTGSNSVTLIAKVNNTSVTVNSGKVCFWPDFCCGSR